MNTDLKLLDRLTIQSRLSELNQTEAFVDAICARLKVNEDYYGNVLIAVTEAVNNAIRHGNKESHDRNVHIDVLNTEDFFEILVSDEGDGFDFNNLPDPTAPENIEKENGRGIFLMKNLAEKVEFENNGKTVKMRFTIN
jgi:serine/threonine-protein kinase RsbW